MTEALILFMKRRILSIFESLWKNNKDTHTNAQRYTQTHKATQAYSFFPNMLGGFTFCELVLKVLVDAKVKVSQKEGFMSEALLETSLYWQLRLSELIFHGKEKEKNAAESGEISD